MPSEDAKKLVKTARLDGLADSQLAALDAAIKSGDELRRRLPKDLHWSEEPAHVFRLDDKIGGRS